MAELTQNEKKLLAALEPLKTAGPDTLSQILGNREEAVIQHAYLLADRGLAEVIRSTEVSYLLTGEGIEYGEKGLPERQLYNSFGDSIPLADLSKNPLSRIGIGQMRKKGWVTIKDGMVVKTGAAPEGEDERALRDPSVGGRAVKDLVKRGLLAEEETVSISIRITAEGAAMVRAGLDLTEETGTLTSSQNRGLSKATVIR